MSHLTKINAIKFKETQTINEKHETSAHIKEELKNKVITYVG
jgi:hypothetical protein